MPTTACKQKQGFGFRSRSSQLQNEGQCSEQSERLILSLLPVVETFGRKCPQA